MSHIFISYAHANPDERDAVVRTLDNEGITDYWYDREISVGDKWRPTIDLALEEADSLILIVTEESMKSHYCTYEWSWALGNQTPVFPVIFNGLDYLHEQIKTLQYYKWQPDLSSEIIQIIQSKRVTPPEILFLNSKILEMLMRFRVAVVTTIWAYPYFKDNFGSVQSLFFCVLEETRSLYSDKLPAFMIEYRNVLQYRQLYQLRLLASKLRQDFYPIFWQPMDAQRVFQHQNANYEDVIQKMNVIWENEIQHSFTYFDTQHQWLTFFQRLVDYLELLNSSGAKDKRSARYYVSPETIIKRAYGETDYGVLLQEIIQHVRDQKFKH